MIRDQRYKIVRDYIKNGGIKTFADIFKYIPKSVVSTELRTNNNRFTRMYNEPFQFKLEELEKIAKAIEVDLRVLLDIVVSEKEQKENKRKKKSR